MASDVLEHIEPKHRDVAIGEVLRVTRQLVIFGFPSGPGAVALDERFHEYHRSNRKVPPEWLEEHLRYPYPDEATLSTVGAEWKVESFGNENLGFHEWLNYRELSRFWNKLFIFLLRASPKMIEWTLRFADRKPFYRRIYILSRRPQ